MRTLERDSFDRLIEALERRGYQVVGPTVRQGAIAYEPLGAAAELPVGITEEQDGGTYRLRRRDDEALFGFANGPQLVEAAPAPAEGPGLARPPRGRRRLRDRAGARATDPSGRSSASARATCTRSAPSTRALLEIEHPDPAYARAARGHLHRRGQLRRPPGAPASASSMDTGPKATLRLRPRADRGARAPIGHHFLVEVGQRARRGGARRAADRGGEAPRRSRPRRHRRADRGEHGPRAGHRRPEGAPLPQPRAPALGRGLRALPDLRQLHDGLPDLLLHRRRGRHRPGRATPSAGSAGTPASRSDFTYVHGGSVRSSTPRRATGSG